MPVASPFLQQIVRLYAYADFYRTVAKYYQEACLHNQQQFLLFDGYTIFRDRWPATDISATYVCSSLHLLSLELTDGCGHQFNEKVMEVTTRVHPIHLGPNKYWFDELNMKLDRRNRVSAYYNS